MKFQTRAVNSVGPSQFGETMPPVVQSSAFAYETPQDLEAVFEGRQFGHVYSRISNPTVSSLEQKLTQLEQGRGSVAVASGMAAVHAVCLALAKSGDSIVVSTSLFGGTYLLFKDVIEPLGITVHYVDPLDHQSINDSITESTRFVFVEAIGNPKLDVPNLKEIATIAHSHKIPLCVDTTLVTPYLLDAKAHGVDIVVSAATKYVAPSGTTVGGYVCDLGNFSWKETKSSGVQALAKRAGDFGFMVYIKQKVVSNVGSLLNPFNAFMLLVGIETLSLRLEQHSQTALKLAQFLQAHSKVDVVNYPGLESNTSHIVAKEQFNGRYSGLLTLRLGTKDNAYTFLSALTLAKNMTNIGDSRTLLIHPATTLYKDLTVEQQEAAGVFPDLIRVSVGLEDADDLINDFKQALDKL